MTDPMEELPTMGEWIPPTPVMEPWLSVEVRRSDAHLIAERYQTATRLADYGIGEVTDEHRAAAWRVEGDTLTAPGPVPALAAALDQIVTHPAYTCWIAAGHTPNPDGVRAELVDGRAVITAPGIVCRGRPRPGLYTDVILRYEDAVALRDAVTALTV